MSVAIIMGTYNGQRYIREQIESIINNTYEDYELHVYDDGSIDSTCNIIQEYAKRDARVLLHRNAQNKGVIRNFLDAARDLEADYYMFCDQDDIWMTNKIEVSLRRIQEIERDNNEIPVAIYSDAVVVDENLKTIHRSFHKQNNLDVSKNAFKNLLLENKLIGCTIMFNRNLRDRLKYNNIDNIRMHDWWIGLVGSAFGKVAYIGTPLVQYRQHGNNEVGSVSEIVYIVKNLPHLVYQRKMLYAICEQAREFVDVYHDEMSKTDIEYANTLANMPQLGWWARRICYVKSGFRKTGLLRNIGVLVIM